jgi:hypothetical protein
MAQLTPLTLSDVIQTVSEFATNDTELLAVVASLINSSQVLLCGKLAGATIDLPAWRGKVPSYGRDAAA